MDRRGFLGKLGIGVAAAGVLGREAIARIPKETKKLPKELLLPPEKLTLAEVTTAEVTTALKSNFPGFVDQVSNTATKVPRRLPTHIAHHLYPDNGLYLQLMNCDHHVPNKRYGKYRSGEYVIQSINDPPGLQVLGSEFTIDGAAMAGYVAVHSPTGIISEDLKSPLFTDFQLMAKRNPLDYHVGCVMWLALRNGPVVAYNFLNKAQHRCARTLRGSQDVAYPWCLQSREFRNNVGVNHIRFYYMAVAGTTHEPRTTPESIRERFVEEGMSNPGELR